MSISSTETRVIEGLRQLIEVFRAANSLFLYHEQLRTARRRASIRARSFRPGDDSTPLATSTIQGRARATRSATFSGVRPPARIRRGRGGRESSRSGAID